MTDVRQWRFRGAGTQVRPGVPVTLHNDAFDVDLPFDVVSLHRPGSSPDPVRGGERLGVWIAGAELPGGEGFLAADEVGGPGLVTAPEERPEWIVSGVAPGVAVPVDRPVALFDAVQGDHLICLDDPAGPHLAWAGDVAAGELRGPLPMPSEFRPPEGVPGDAELSGVLVPVREGDDAPGLLLLLDPPDAHRLGEHLRSRVPRLAERVAADGTVPAVACLWSAAGGPTAAGTPLPPAGARLWVQGRLVADPGVCLHPVRALAWALDGDGLPVDAAPGATGWPEAAITWHVLLLPQPDGGEGRAEGDTEVRAEGDTEGRAEGGTEVRAEGGTEVRAEGGTGDGTGDGPHGGSRGTVLYLPLPGRDGEPGSATTFTPVRPAEPTSRGGRRGSRRRTGSSGVVPDPRTGQRVLRIGVVPGAVPGVVAAGCTARVHVRGGGRSRGR